MADNEQVFPDSQRESMVSFAVVPDHELISLIGRGSYGEVWLAKNTLGSFRAVKLVHEKTFRHRRPFEREFNGVRKFEPISRLHEGLVDILQVGRNEAMGYFYCVMELADDAVSGQKIDPAHYTPRTLARDISKHKELPVEECQRIGIAIASALDFLHGRGLVHRDVKPSNIVFVNGVPKLADIGLVAEVSEARSYVGTEGFIPPEGPGTAQSDIYSLGKVLYEISTGKDRHDYPEPPTRLDDSVHSDDLIELNKVILKACRSNPLDRYQTASDLTKDLLAIQRGESVSTQIPTPLKRKSLQIIGLASCAAVVLVMLFHPQTWFGAEQKPYPISSAGLVGWWRAENNGQDTVGTNNTVLYGVGFGNGKVGRAFNLISSWHRVQIPDSDDFKLTNSLTIEGWVFMRSGGGFIFHRGDSRPGLDPYALGTTGSGKLDFNLNQSLTEYADLLAPLPLNEWKHVAATLEGMTGDMKIYIDGKLVAQTNTTVRPLRDLDPKYEPSIGIGNVGTMRINFCFDGMLDEIALYSRALSQKEIEGIYHAGTNGKVLPAQRSSTFSRREVQPPRAANPIPAPSGVVSWWTGEGNADDAAGTNHGVLMNNVTFAQGMAGMAFRFNGSNSFVKIPKSPDLDALNQMTIEFWMKADTDNAMNACCQGLFGSDFYDVGIAGTDYPIGINFGISTDDGVSIIQTCDGSDRWRVISSGEWHHVAGTYDGNALQAYVDGVPWGKSMPCSGRISPMRTNSFITLGSEDGRTFCPFCIGGRYFQGLMDEVTVYKRALSPGEVLAIFKAGSAGKVASHSVASKSSP